MGRISRSKKEQMSLANNHFLQTNNQHQAMINQSLMLNRNMNKEIIALIVLNKNSLIDRLNTETNLYFPKEFKCWLKYQLEQSKKMLYF